MKRGLCVGAVGIFVAASCLAPTRASAAGVSVVQGDHYGARIFPDNFFTLPDSTEVSGLRVHFRQGIDYAACDSTDYSVCDTFAMLNNLDGFDLQPRVTVPLTSAVKLSSVDDSDFYITDASGGFVSGLRQLVFDPASNTLSGISDQFLTEDTPFRVVVTSGIQDSSGNSISACASSCVVPFTTRTASSELVNIRKSMDLPVSDPSNAYRLANFPSASTDGSGRKASFQQGTTTTVFQASTVLPSVSSQIPAQAGIVRNDQVSTNPATPLNSSAVPNLIPPGAAGYYAFGSFLSPRYQFASASGQQDNPYNVGDGHTDGEIPPVPTKQTGGAARRGQAGSHRGHAGPGQVRAAVARGDLRPRFHAQQLRHFRHRRLQRRTRHRHAVNRSVRAWLRTRQHDDDQPDRRHLDHLQELRARARPQW